MANPTPPQPNVPLAHPEKKERSWGKILGIMLGIILLAGAVAGGYYLTRGSKKPTTAAKSPAATVAPKASELVSVDETWNRYINHKLGWSMRIPKTVYAPSACTSNPNVRFSTTPADGQAVTTYEDGRVVYIAPKKLFELTGKVESIDKSGASHLSYSGCRAVADPVAFLKMENDGLISEHWKITTQTINSDADLTTLIHSVYGPTCSLGSKTPTDDSGVLSVSAKGKGDLQNPQDGDCIINYASVFKYSPAKKLAVIWLTGQSSSFSSSGDEGAVYYDSEMVSSFRFE